MIRLLCRKYLCILLYILVFYFLFLSLLSINNDVSFLNSFDLVFLIILCNSMLIRLLDDYKDYEIDLNNNKVVFKKGILLILITIIIIINLVLSINYNILINFIIIGYLVLIINNLFIKKYNLEFLKIFILPILVIHSFYLLSYTYKLNIYCYIFSFFTCLLNIVFLLYKKKR